VTLNQGQASIKNDLPLWTILAQCLQKISAAFQLSDKEGVFASSSTLERLIQAIFDSHVQGFLRDDSALLFAQLESSVKAQIFAQPVAGFVAVMRRLAKAGEVSTASFNRELQLWSEGPHRNAMLETIEQSDLFSHCYMTSQISDLILKASEPKQEEHEMTAEETEQMLTWATDLAPQRNMGLPWGFSIIPVN